MLQPIAALRARPRAVGSLRRSLLAVIALAAPAAGAAPALAGPSSGPTGGNVFNVGRGWGPTGGMAASAAEQSVRAEPASVHGAYGTDDLGALGYCEPYGPNVVITAFTYDVVRWHGTASAATVEAGGGTDAGSPMVVSTADGAFAPGLRTTQVANGLASECIGARVRQTAPQALSFGRIWNLVLTSTTFEDQEWGSVSAPAVSGPSSGGWLTGPIDVTWSSTDNGNLPWAPWGAVHAGIGGGEQRAWSGTDAPPGAHAATLQPGASGVQQVVVSRESPGWGAESSAAVTVKVDLSAPAVSGPAQARDGAGRATFSWTQSDTGSGVAGCPRVQALVAGAWADLPGSCAAAGDGARSVGPLVQPAWADGALPWRVVVADGAGHTTVATGPGAYLLDRTGPTVAGLESSMVAGVPTQRRVAFTLADAGVGLGSGQPTSVEVRPLGSTAAWTPLADASAPRTAGSHVAVAGTAGLPVGRYELRVVARDAFGNTRAVARTADDTGAFIVDREPPVATGRVVPQPHPGARVDLSLADPHGGVGFDPAADDLWIQAEQPAGSGRWVDLVAGRRGAGDHTLALDISALSPGPHAARLRAVDALGQASLTPLDGSFVVDGDPPAIRQVRVTPLSADRAEVAFVVDDGAAGTGVSAADPFTVECDTGAGWRLAADLDAGPDPVSDGPNVRVVDLSACPEGVAPAGGGIRLSGRDRAGNAAVVVAPADAFAAYPAGALTIDRTAPAVTAMSAEPAASPGGATFRFLLADPPPSIGFAGGGEALVQVEDTLQAGTPWVTVGRLDAVPGARSAELSLAAVGQGQRTRWRVVVADRVGNVRTAASGPAALVIEPPVPPPARAAESDLPPAASGDPAPAPAPHAPLPAADPVPAGSRLEVDRARVMAANRGQARLGAGGVRFLVRYPRPRPIVLEGVFRAPGGVPVAGARLELVELGLVRAEGATDAAGAFRFRYTPTASGEIRVRWGGTARVRPISVGWEVEVVPYLAAGASRRIPSGGRLAVYGTFLPRPAAISAIAPTLRSRHARSRRGQPVLVYQVSPRRCPAYSGLRPVPARLLARVPERCFVGPLVQDRTALIRPNGRFATSARLRGPEGVRAYTIYVQGRVLATGGWPFAEARTRVFPVRLVAPD